jgi:hypothetical protein
MLAAEFQFFISSIVKSQVSENFPDAELEAYLDETLDSDRANEIEEALKDDRELLERLTHINGRRNAGVHTLGEIWRRNQIGVPSVEMLGNYILGVTSAEESDYIEFRMDKLKCPFTLAMHDDLVRQRNENAEQSTSRREKFFKSSANLLKKPDKG